MLKQHIQHGHSKKEIACRLAKTEHSYLRDWIYGGIDGAVTTFAVVAGVEGAQLQTIVIFILGIANLLGDGFSMAAANYLGTKAEKEEYKFCETNEHRHIKENPLGETEEVRQMFKQKGFDGEMLEKIVTHITSNHHLWVKTMLHEEYGLAKEIRSPWIAGLCTFLSFLLCGSVPLLPFALHASNPFLLAAISTGIIFFAIGSFKSLWSTQGFWRSGFTTLFIGGIAASLAYSVGVLFTHFKSIL